MCGRQHDNEASVVHLFLVHMRRLFELLTLPKHRHGGQEHEQCMLVFHKIWNTFTVRFVLACLNSLHMGTTTRSNQQLDENTVPLGSCSVCVTCYVILRRARVFCVWFTFTRSGRLHALSQSLQPGLVKRRDPCARQCCLSYLSNQGMNCAGLNRKSSSSCGQKR